MSITRGTHTLCQTFGAAIFAVSIASIAALSAQPARATEGSPRPTAPASAASLFRVASLEGEAWSVGPEQDAEKKSIAKGDTLAEGTTVQTGVRSKLKLLLPGDIALEIQPESEFKLVRKTPTSPDWGAHLQRGGILSVVRNPAKRPSHFYVRTRSAAMGVRGTMFYVRSREKEYDFFCACNGSVTLQRPTDAQPAVITSHHHDAPKVVHVESGKIEAAQNVHASIEHTDEELAALQALLGPMPQPSSSPAAKPAPRSSGASQAR